MRTLARIQVMMHGLDEEGNGFSRDYRSIHWLANEKYFNQFQRAGASLTNY